MKRTKFSVLLLTFAHNSNNPPTVRRLREYENLGDLHKIAYYLTRDIPIKSPDVTIKVYRNRQHILTYAAGGDKVGRIWVFNGKEWVTKPVRGFVRDVLMPSIKKRKVELSRDREYMRQVVSEMRQEKISSNKIWGGLN